MLEREEVVSRCRSTSPPYYQKDHENEEYEQRVKNSKPSDHYVVEQKVYLRASKCLEELS
jgi:hypothetical protein